MKSITRSRWWVAVLLAVPALVLVLAAPGCSEDETTEPPEQFDPPSALRAINEDGAIRLQWTASSYQSADDFAGYSIYRSSSSMAGVADAALSTYRIRETNGTSTSYADQEPENGVKYYYLVRARKDGGALSERSNEINTAARAEGDDLVWIYEFAYTGQPSGLNCNEPGSYAMESSAPNDNRPKIDLYLGTADAVSDRAAIGQTTQELVLKSPHLVLNSNTAWAARQAQLLDLGSGQTAWDRYDAPSSGWSASVNLGGGTTGVDKVIAVKTPPGPDGHPHYAKIWVQEVDDDTPGRRAVSFLVAWQSAPDYPRFSGR